MDQNSQDQVTRQLWRRLTEDGPERLFLIPEDHTLKEGDFLLQTRLGREWRVAEAVVLPFEIPAEDAEAILQEEFGKVLDEGRKRILDGLEKLRRKARQVPPDVQAAPPERREAVAGAFEALAAGLEKLTQGGARRLRDAAGEIRHR